MKQLILLTSLLVAAVTDSPPDFRVVVNEANPVSARSRQELSDLFLKKNSEWPRDDEWAGRSFVLPVDQPEGTAVREQFNREIHRKSSSAVRAYWQQRIFSGRDVPPPEKEGDAEVLAYVRRTPGAVGYISSTSSTAGVKVVEVRR